MADEPVFPQLIEDETEQLLDWLRWLRGCVLRKAGGITDEQARWTPDGRLIPLLGLVNHLTRVEWRWIDGAMQGQPVERHESEFGPESETTIDQAIAAYGARAAATDAYARTHDLDQRGVGDAEVTLRWVLLHLINETARHAGHADATRELLDGSVGE